MKPNFTGSNDASMEGPLQALHILCRQNMIWSPWTFLVSDWVKHKKNPLKLLGQMEQYFTSSIYARSFTKLAHFVPIVQKHGRNLVDATAGGQEVAEGIHQSSRQTCLT